MTDIPDRTKVFGVLVIILMVVLFLSACGAQTSPPAPTSSGTVTIPYTFAKDVLPIFQSRCLNCHGATNPKAGLNLSSYQSLMAGSQNGADIVPGDASSSKLIQLVMQGKMPKSGPKLLPNQLQTLINWVQAGAKNN